MRFKLDATSMPYAALDNPNIAVTWLEKYIEKIKNADDSLELPEPVIEHHKVFSGKAKDVSVLTYVIAALFIVKFFAELIS